MILGIDFSSQAIHLVLLDDDTDTAEATVVELAGATPFERARSARLFFPPRSWFEDKGVWLVGIEDPHSRANHTAKALGLAAGAIAALLPTSLTVVQTPPAEWKRVFTGNARAQKLDVWRRCVELYPAAFDWSVDNNLTDAYGIAHAVRTINNQAVERATA